MTLLPFKRASCAHCDAGRSVPSATAAHFRCTSGAAGFTVDSAGREFRSRRRFAARSKRQNGGQGPKPEALWRRSAAGGEGAPGRFNPPIDIPWTAYNNTLFFPPFFITSSRFGG